MAAIVGLDPWPYSLRELIWMSEAKQTESWNHTATMLATIENCAMTKKRRPTQPADRHPFAKRAPRKLSRAESLRMLDQMVGL